MRSASLRILELRVDSAADKAAAAASGAGSGHLDCIGVASALQELRLWGLTMTRAPSWGQLERLRVLEIVGAHLQDLAVSGAVYACPNLTELALLGCECAGSVSFALPLLERCRLDFVGSGSCTLALSAPRVESLEVQGFNWIVLQGGDRLKHLTIAKNTGTRTDKKPIIHDLPRQLSFRPMTFSVGGFRERAYCGDREAPGVGAPVAAWCPVDLGSRQPSAAVRHRGEASRDEG
jgi:hypothetical protein